MKVFILVWKNGCFAWKASSQQLSMKNEQTIQHLKDLGARISGMLLILFSFDSALRNCKKRDFHLKLRAQMKPNSDFAEKRLIFSAASFSTLYVSFVNFWASGQKIIAIEHISTSTSTRWRRSWDLVIFHYRTHLTSIMILGLSHFSPSNSLVRLWRVTKFQKICRRKKSLMLKFFKVSLYDSWCLLIFCDTWSINVTTSNLRWQPANLRDDQ